MKKEDLQYDECQVTFEPTNPHQTNYTVTTTKDKPKKQQSDTFLYFTSIIMLILFITHLVIFHGG